MIIRTDRKTEMDYRIHESVSQSKLKYLLRGVSVYNTVDEDDQDEYYIEKAHFIIGSAVDTLITMGKDVFKEEYYVSQLEKKPGKTMMSIIVETFDFQMAASHGNLTYESFTSNVVKRSLMMAVRNHNWQKRWNDDTKYNKIISEGQDYWNSLIDASGKKVLSNEQFITVSHIYESLISSSYTEKYFEDADHLELYFQLPLYFKYNGVDCKGLLDLVIVDHANEKIIPIDIKTMGDYTINFPYSFYRRRYDFQAAFYTQAILNSDFNKWCYKVDNFKFIVESTINPGTPLVFTCTEEVLLKKGKFGIPDRKIGDIIIKGSKGFHQAIEIYKWHLENGFEIDRVVSINDGDLLLGIEGIIQ
tara:strand:+ start:3079 stop:4158 length:1080 start_codon:yes stop_codon:yes gene_type:complete